MYLDEMILYLNKEYTLPLTKSIGTVDIEKLQLT